MSEIIGFDDCPKILIEYTDPNKPLNERIIAYINDPNGDDVKITAELKPGVSDGDTVYYQHTAGVYAYLAPIPGGAKDGEYSWPRCPSTAGTVPGETVQASEGYLSSPVGPFTYPLTKQDTSWGYELVDGDNYSAGYFYKQEYPIDYVATVTQVCDGPYYFNWGEEYYNTQYIEDYQTYNWSWIPTWNYCDELGNPLEAEQTIIKVFKKENEQWVEKEEYKLSGNLLPVKAGCEEGCEEDCIELYDATGTARICLCNAVYGDARDNVFPNLDLPEWKPFD